jgi:hypothetical protein
MTDQKETAHAIKQCLIYLMDDAVIVGLDSCAFHMAMALKEAEQTLGQDSDIINELAKRLLASDDHKHTH